LKGKGQGNKKKKKSKQIRQETKLKITKQSKKE